MLKVFEITHKKEIEYLTSPSEHKAKIKFCDYKGWSLEDYRVSFSKCREITGKELETGIIDSEHNYDGCIYGLTFKQIAEREIKYDSEATECIGFKNI